MNMRKAIYLASMALICGMTSCSKDEEQFNEGDYCVMRIFESMKRLDENCYLFHNQFSKHDEFVFESFIAMDTNRYAINSYPMHLPCIDGTYSYTIAKGEIFAITHSEDGGFIVKFNEKSKQLNPNCGEYSLNFLEDGVKGMFWGIIMQYDGDKWVPTRNSYMFDEDSISYDAMKEHFSRK